MWSSITRAIYSSWLNQSVSLKAKVRDFKYFEILFEALLPIIAFRVPIVALNLQ